MAATTIDDLQIKIEADAKTASDKLDALAQSMVKLASSLSINVGKMSGVAIGLNSITRASQNLNSRNIKFIIMFSLASVIILLCGFLQYYHTLHLSITFYHP